jgi:hypothetical protein
MVMCLLFLMPLLPLADPFIFTYLICFSLSFAVSGTILKPGFLRTILSLNFLSLNSLHFPGRKVSLFIFLSFTFRCFLLCSKYAPNLVDVFLSTLSLSTEILMAAGLFRLLETDGGIFKFVYLFNLYYGKYYIPFIFIVINSIIVWQNRKRFCQHLIHRYPRFLILYISTFFMELVFLLNPFITYPLDRFANLSFIIFAQIPLLGYSLYIIFLRKGSILGLGSAVLVLCLLWTLGFFTCFSSPYNSGISEAISQNEVYRFQWLSRVNENHSYIMSFEEKEGSNALPEKFSGNLNRSAELTKISDMHIYTSKSDSDWVIPSKS